jgi:phage/plasmid-like protein (TIGR03299 family)
MPHNIGEMFYYGERPWHGLGRRLSKPANLEEALHAGGLDWEVDLLPLAIEHEPASAVPHRVAVVRRDRPPGNECRVVGVVHPGFQPLQNRQGAELFDALFARGERVYHTGGYLKHGEVVWLLAKLPDDIQVQGKDVVEPYLLYSNSHDGSQAIDIRLTTIRVVCNNTLSVALSRGGADKVFHRAHSGSYQLVAEEAKEFFSFAMKQTRELQAIFEQLAKARCEDEAFEKFLKKLLPNPAKPATAKPGTPVLRAWETRCATLDTDRKAIQTVRQEGIPRHGIAPEQDTWWGALNAVTGWVDHLQEIEGDRYAYILMGQGDQLKTRALRQIVKEYVPA